MIEFPTWHYSSLINQRHKLGSIGVELKWWYEPTEPKRDTVGGPNLGHMRHGFLNIRDLK